MLRPVVNDYFLSLVSILALCVLYVIQIIVGDLAQDGAGHTPGRPFEGSHDQFAFRAIRAPANSLENMPFMISLIGLGIALGASSAWLNGLALLCVAARFVHMSAYYADKRYVRGYSWMFGVLLMTLLCGVDIWAVVTTVKS